jgi:hypothetical protein
MIAGDYLKCIDIVHMKDGTSPLIITINMIYSLYFVEQMFLYIDAAARSVAVQVIRRDI